MGGRKRVMISTQIPGQRSILTNHTAHHTLSGLNVKFTGLPLKATPYSVNVCTSMQTNMQSRL
jgi:hypothetical protein